MWWMFWVIPFLCFVAMTRHWRRDQWARDYRGPSRRRDRDVNEQREYMDAMERRVAELEERLDFTERLLAKRSDQTTPTPA